MKIIILLVFAILGVIDAQEECVSGQWQCDDKTQCIREDWKCDEWEDCTDGSDESDDNCRSGECPPYQHQCPDTCIPNTWKCDGYTDCIDNSDEQGCRCKDDEWQCKNEQCIKKEHVCDGDDIWDCTDGSDVCDCPIDLPDIDVKNKSPTYTPIELENLKLRQKLSKLNRMAIKNRLASKNSTRQFICEELGF